MFGVDYKITCLERNSRKGNLCGSIVQLRVVQSSRSAFCTEISLIEKNFKAVME